jgi:hypothetical protein
MFLHICLQLQVVLLLNIYSFLSITLNNTQNVMEMRVATLYLFEAAEFENDIEIFSLAIVFELQ